jgi:hypothetical protein
VGWSWWEEGDSLIVHRIALQYLGILNTSVFEGVFGVANMAIV